MIPTRSAPDSQHERADAPSRTPSVGELAPDFEEPGRLSHPRSLARFRGSPFVLVFSAAEWDPAAEENIRAYNALIASLPGLAGAPLLRIGHEGPWRNFGFADIELSIPIVTGADDDLARRWGVSRASAVFVVDEHGVVRWRFRDGDTPPSAEEITRALAAMAPVPSVASSTDAKTTGRWTRREFVTTASAASFAIALSPLTRRADMLAQSPVLDAARTGTDAAPVTLNVNGKQLSLQLDSRVTLLDALREYSGLTGTKKGCDHGQCGACTVHVNDKRVLSCLTFAVMQQGKKITTIEGLADGDTLHPMQEAFLVHDGFQCGYCTPGQIMSACAVVKEPWGADDSEVREAMSGNICRCGAYPNIVAAIQEVRHGATTTENGSTTGATGAAS